MSADRQKILFIGWDAADWKAIHPLMDAGKMPNLQALVERGAMGRAATLHPPLSPMLWTSIATGKRPFKHGIHGFAEPTPDGRGVRPITNLSRTTKAIWNILNQNGWRSTVVGWWPSHPAEPINGAMVSDHYHRANRPIDKAWPLPANSVYPPELHDTLAELRLHPQELVGPMLAPFLPALEKVDQKKDRRFSALCRTIAECVSIHSAATWLIENRPWDFFAVYYDAIDHFCHGFMKYHPPRRPFISEEDFELYSNVVSTAYILHDQMLGTLLRQAAGQEGGEKTRVILMSDHGFHPDHLRPSGIPDFPAGPAVEHSHFGIFVMAGPGIKKDEPLHGVSVLDLTPTVLTLCGLPVGEDMDGRAVVAAFEDPPEARTVPSWDDVPPIEGCSDGRHPPHTRLDPVAAAEALEQLVALGYVEKPDQNIETAVERTVRELRFNLLEAYQDAGRHHEALDIARDLTARDPDDQRYALKRFISCQALGLTAEMREIADDMDGRRRTVFEQAGERMKEFGEIVRRRYEDKKNAAGEKPDEAEFEREIAWELNPRAEPDEPREFLLTPGERDEMKDALNRARFNPGIANLMQAETLTAEKRWFEALEAVERMARENRRPATLLQSAGLLRRLGRHAEAESRYREALVFDPDNTHAWLGICRLELRRRNYQGAVDAALECRGRLPFYPMAHFLEGIARVGLGEYRQAKERFLQAVSQNPNFPQAHLWLGRLLKYRLGDDEAAREHIRLYKEMRSARRAAPAKLADARTAGPPLPKADERQADERQAPISLPPITDEVLVISGLPRSGTSMLMQMVDAAGIPVLTDAVREADEDNPRGYFEYEAARRLFRDQSWVREARGKAVKVVAPLVCSLPAGCRYRVILIEREYDEILESQARMIRRKGDALPDSIDRRERLRGEYARTMIQTKALLARRPDVHLLLLRHEDVLRDPAAAASMIGEFTGGGLDIARMSAVVDRALHRNRSPLDGSEASTAS